MYFVRYEKIKEIIKMCRGQSAALGRRMPWATRLFSKSMKGKISNFLHDVTKIISVIKFSEKIDFPLLEKKPHIQGTKVNFLFKVFLY